MVMPDEYARTPMSFKTQLIVALVLMLIIGGALAVWWSVSRGSPKCPPREQRPTSSKVVCLEPAPSSRAGRLAAPLQGGLRRPPPTTRW